MQYCCIIRRTISKTIFNISTYKSHATEESSQLAAINSMTVVVVVYRLNVPLNTLQVISGTIFTGQMTKPTVVNNTIIQL